ncbi:MAG: Acetylornithine aminotransferase [Firmicutes bacterium ADurb.Bin419]|nr:MAG: Acetylornithine aminotransferase [Firmicutes bacterium ADurb.Bin419]
MEYRETQLLRKNHIFPCISTYYDEPIYITKGEGQYLFDHEGQKYLDFYSGVATASMGYANKSINDAIIKQLSEFQHMSTLYLSEPMLKLASLLKSKLASDDYKVLFCNSGSEGIEYITLLARLYKKDGYLLSLSHGYHGMTLYANYLTGIESWKHHKEIKLEAHPVSTPYCYRCKYKSNTGTCGFECALEIESAIKTYGVEQFSGFLFETVLGVGGVIVPPREYFNIALSIVKKYGGLVLVDEVQTGMGRTGKWYGFQNYDIEPDAFCLGKSLGNGLPIGAVIARNHIADQTEGSQIYCTFGSNPVACSASLATINVMDQNNILEDINIKGEYFFKKLQELYELSFVGDIRGLGLMIGIEIVKDKNSKEPDSKLALNLHKKLKEENILIGIGGVYKNVLRIAPPYIITKDDIDTFFEALVRIIKTYSQK